MITLIFILFIAPIAYPLELKKLSTCQTALGMQSGSILDAAISASSSYDPLTVGPRAARARTEQYGGAWCPLNTITSMPKEWLEIEFDNLTYLTQVESQGRFDNGRGKEYTEYFILMYTRMSSTQRDPSQWIEYRPWSKERNSSWIRANQNTFAAELRPLNPPIIAKRLRFYPVSSQPRTVCMRVEVYGCLFTDNIVSYSMPQGRTDVNSLGDDTYDGQYISSNNMLVDGLGQLSDGVTGAEDLSLIDGRQPWIGWTNESSRYITILFQFESIRQINRVTIHASNLFSKEIFIFKTAIISFSNEKDEPNYSNAIIYQHHRDEIFEIARPILIELNNHLAKFVRLDLYFDSKWMLISEVTFDTQIYQEKPVDVKEKTVRKISHLVPDGRKRHREISSTAPMISSTPLPPVLTVELSLAFVIGASLALGLLLIGSLLWIVRQKKKLQFQKLTEKPFNHSSCCTYPTLPIREFYDYNAPVSSATEEREYAVPEVNFYSTFSPKHLCHNVYPTLKSVGTCCVHPYPDRSVLPTIEAMCGNSSISRMPMGIAGDQQRSINELKSDQLIFEEKLTDGKYGSLHLAQFISDQQRLVLVKVLKENVPEDAKKTFLHEIDLLSDLNHPSICSLIGAVQHYEVMAVMEYYPMDLYQYLREQTIPMDNSSASSFLLSFACQIASAMKYLSSLDLVHRDLAARNCLISPHHLQIHLSDVAMGKSMYANDYARIGREQSRIPIRWAAWESIFLNQYSIKSDVWSFGVTLYELFTFCRQRPYHMLTNEELVRQMAPLSICSNSSSNLRLPQPNLSSKEIYDMMCECWQSDAQRRPSFADLHTFLVGRASGSLTLTLNRI